MLRANRKPTTDSEMMILNNYKAITEVRELKDEKLTSKLLCQLQATLLEGLEKPEAVGRFRKAEEFVRVETRDTFEVLHVPPKASELDWRIQEVCDFANTNSSPFVHPIVKAAILHLALGYIHPFVDGNGRTARAIFYWYLLKSNYWVLEYFPISRVLARAPTQYARAYLRTKTDDGDATYFVNYHLTVLLAAMKDFHAYLAAQRQETLEAEHLLEKYPGLNHRQRSVIHDAIKNSNKKFTMRVHQGKFHVTYPTAHADMMGLVKLGLLKSTKEGKTIILQPAENLKKKLHLSSRLPHIGEVKNPKNIAVTRSVDPSQSKKDAPPTESPSLFD
jgi:Fic family protein